MKKGINWVCVVGMSLLIMACNSEKKNEEQKTNDGKLPRAEVPDPVVYVGTEVLNQTNFYHELLTNGKLISRKKVDMRFSSSEPVESIFVKNGDRVKKGMKIAELNKIKIGSQLEQAEIALFKARLSYHELLMGQGYSLDDTLNLKDRTVKVLSSKSGYDVAQVNYNNVLREWDQATMTAPFDGVIANLFDKELNYPENKSFCTLMDNSQLEINFSILENELGVVEVGDEVSVKPLVIEHDALKGHVEAINPLVDANGLVQVRAVIANPTGKLYDGMNVRIAIQRTVPEQLVVPKSAVVLRSGKKVLFTKKEGRAYWNYVETELENSDSYTVSGKELKAGDSVIISNNMSLAHDVMVKEEKP